MKEIAENLPDGDYNGYVYILVDTVGSGLNYGRKKFQIEFTVADGPYKDYKITYHRVIFPHFLANQPPEGSEEFSQWQKSLQEYMEETIQLLVQCGVEFENLSFTEVVEFTRKIALNNIQRPLVHFTVQQGIPKIRSLLRKDSEITALPDLPDGNNLLIA